MRGTASVLVVIVALLLAGGIVMLASTSSVRGAASHQDAEHFLKRQLTWLAASVLAGIALVHFDYHRWRKLAIPLALATVVLLGLVFVPGIGVKVGGSHRWLRGGPFSFQPSEFAKLAVVIVLAAWMEAAGSRVGTFVGGVLLPGAWLGVVLGLIIKEPDFGTTLLTGVLGMAMLYGGGARLTHLALSGLGAGCAFVVAVLMDPVRLARVRAILDPAGHPASAYHALQSKTAFIRGGWRGVGLGESIQKQFYLPEAHTDFILAIIGEETGFVGTALVVLLFLALTLCGARVSLRAPDPFGRLLAFGVTMWLSLQAVVNIGVVTGCFPTKGLALPFISYGGSCLLACVSAAAILVNVALHSGSDVPDEHTHFIRDEAHSL